MFGITLGWANGASGPTGNITPIDALESTGACNLAVNSALLLSISACWVSVFLNSIMKISSSAVANVLWRRNQPFSRQDCSNILSLKDIHSPPYSSSFCSPSVISVLTVSSRGSSKSISPYFLIASFASSSRVSFAIRDISSPHTLPRSDLFLANQP